MRINFRQGLISFQRDVSNPVFLQESSTAGYVDHVVSPTPTLIAFAHGTSDYLKQIDVSVVNAWGPIVPSVDNYLYWDVDLLTAQVSRGITTLTPVNSLTAPTSPANGLHWFDLTTTQMKVWDQVANKWRVKVRVFAGRVVNGSTNQIVMNTEGSQVGLSTPSNPGFIVLDTLLQPIRKSVGEFLTDDDQSRVLTTSGTSGVLVQPTNRIIPVKAGESIPRMSLVYFSGADTVRLASSNQALIPMRIPVGIILDDLTTNDVGTIVTNGEISYDQWDWAGDEGKPLYCNDVGELSVTRPAGLFAYRVGFVKNSNTILFNVDAETYPQVYTADVNSLLVVGVSPIQTTDTVNGLGERVISVSAPAASGSTSGFLSSSMFTQIQGFNSRITDAEVDILDLQTNKSDVGHVHTIANVTGLQTELTDLQTELDLKINIVTGATVGNFPAFNSSGALVDSGFTDDDFALAVHSHSIPDVLGLQDALNLKANETHTHVISDVTNLQTSLDAKSDVGHVHIIANVTGLQTALDAKAALSHTHTIANVTGLQVELDNKAFVSHTHTIANVTGLQTALDAKAALSHTHVAANIVANGTEGQILTQISGQTVWADPPAEFSLPSTTVVLNT